MECHYINLDSAIDRRAALEANFTQCARQGWKLNRFSAINDATVEKDQVPGKRDWREKACFLSHKRVIEAQADDGRHFMVMEDDARLGMTSHEIIEGLLAENHDAEWDLLFTDIGIQNMETMMLLALHRQQLIDKRMVIALDLAKISFVGAAAYVVNGRSRRRLLDYLAAGIPVDTEYDVYLNRGIADGHLKAAVLFPFATTLSKHSQKSQIQPSVTYTANLARDTFRRMMWLESSAESHMDDFARIDSRLQGTLCGKVAMLAGALYFED
jgi:GR25 family glycosyltransferase involved in LPS biosynthesis